MIYQSSFSFNPKTFTTRIILALILCLFISANALRAGEVALPRFDFQAKYRLDKPEQKIFPISKLPLIKDVKGGFLVCYNFSGEDHIVFLSKRTETGFLNAYEDEQNLISLNGLKFINFEYGYFLFQKGRRYNVAGKSNENVSLHVNKGGKSTTVTIPQAHFIIMSEDAYVAAVEAQQLRQKQAAAQARRMREEAYARRMEESAARAILADQAREKKKNDFDALVSKCHSLQYENIKPTEEVSDAICIIKTRTGSGTGFLHVMEGRAYVISNIHVIGDAEDLKMTTGSGRVLKPLLFELAHDRDLVRIQLAEVFDPSSPYLFLGPQGSASLDDEVAVYGNSGGKGVITLLRGKVNGISFDEIETDAEFISGNSGSPILNATNEIIGVATILYSGLSPQDWTVENTRFTEARRFGVRINSNIKWLPFSPEELRLVNRGIASYDTRLKQSYEIIKSHYLKPTIKIPKTTFDSPRLSVWIHKYNRMRVGSLEESKHVKTLGHIFDLEAREAEGLLSLARTSYHTNEIEQIRNTFNCYSNYFVSYNY